MSPKTCLFVTALALPGLLPACIDPAMQGSSGATEDTTDTTSTGEPTTGTTGPTTSGSVMTSDTLTTVTPEGCDDGAMNGSETDIDCGGDVCDPCDDGGACGSDDDCASNNCDDNTCAGLAASCLALYMADAGLPSGTYPLDPDGDGTPTDYYCDMEPDSPGWTQVFAPDLDGTWDPVKDGDCGGPMQGPFGMGDVLTLDTTAAGVAHTELRVKAEAVIVDSWDAFDNEQLTIKLGDADIFSQLCDYQSSFSCNQETDLCGSMEFFDGVLPIATAPAPHDGDAIALSFSSNLNEGIDNEAWGLRAVYVLVK